MFSTQHTPDFPAGTERQNIPSPAPTTASGIDPHTVRITEFTKLLESAESDFAAVCDQAKEVSRLKEQLTLDTQIAVERILDKAPKLLSHKPMVGLCLLSAAQAAINITFGSASDFYSVFSIGMTAVALIALSMAVNSKKAFNSASFISARVCQSANMHALFTLAQSTHTLHALMTGIETSGTSRAVNNEESAQQDKQHISWHYTQSKTVAEANAKAIQALETLSLKYVQDYVTLKYLRYIDTLFTLAEKYFESRNALFAEDAPRYRHAEMIEQGEKLLAYAKKVTENLPEYRFRVPPNPEFTDAYYNTPSRFQVLLGKHIERKKS